MKLVRPKFLSSAYQEGLRSMKLVRPKRRKHSVARLYVCFSIRLWQIGSPQSVFLPQTVRNKIYTIQQLFVDRPITFIKYTGECDVDYVSFADS
jgi:hypothetical protein